MNVEIGNEAAQFPEKCIEIFFRIITRNCSKDAVNGDEKVSKKAEFHADFKSVEKFLNKCTKKVIS